MYCFVSHNIYQNYGAIFRNADVTNPGKYFQNVTSTATSLLNYPEAVAGVLVSYGAGAILEDVGRSVCLIIRQ